MTSSTVSVPTTALPSSVCMLAPPLAIVIPELVVTPCVSTAHAGVPSIATTTAPVTRVAALASTCPESVELELLSSPEARARDHVKCCASQAGCDSCRDGCDARNALGRSHDRTQPTPLLLGAADARDDAVPTKPPRRSVRFASGCAHGVAAPGQSR